MFEIKKNVYYHVVGGAHESKEFDEDTEDIYLSGRNITHVDFVHFKSFKFLKRLSVNFCNISSADLSPLSECNRLEKLALFDNKILEINLTPLMNCVQLEELALSDNKFESIDLSQLSCHPTLKKIDLGSNRISEFSFKPLETLSNLTSISVRNNHLQSANLSPLSESQNLMNIDLSGNSIRRIDLSPLRDSPSFRTLSLSSNKLETIELEHLSNIETLESLELASNRLRKINLYPLQNCRLLKKINLTYNELQELDITPLYLCPNLSHIGVDNGVLVRTDSETASQSYKPEGIKTLKRITVFHSEEEKKKAKSTRKPKKDEEKLEFIKSRDFTGKFYELVNEINDAFNSKCYVCTTFLSRKLMENLVISILTKIFGHTNEDYYVRKNKEGRVIGNKRFAIVLQKFWDVFQKDISKFSHLHDEKQLAYIEKKMTELRDDFNVDVHELGTFRSKKKLLAIREELGNIISFLRELDSRIK